MAIFKSRQQRRLEREIQIKKGLSAIRRQIRNLKRQEKNFLKKAVRARQLGDTTQYNFIRGVIKKTAAQRRMMERQLLAIETALAGRGAYTVCQITERHKPRHIGRLQRDRL